LRANDVDAGFVAAAFASIVIPPAGDGPERASGPSTDVRALRPAASVSLRHLGRQREKKSALK